MLEDSYRAKSEQEADIVFRREDGWVIAHFKYSPERVVKSRTWEGALLDLLLSKHPYTHFETGVPVPLGEDIPGLNKIREAELQAEKVQHEQLVTA